uniref:Uncharacterized protein n=1 Tax=Candidatus Kentrum sp. FM TaxID=2126340 RepID=A0A450VY26_9GAMM|nr:MAG: hypothetical protein BECKFM1743C_GA0114222_100663 [Candidatus Kentron sp. FM]VFJ62661.1 MAG: hypothetical protein BECKFM1743A_GA0114220_103123 [Candidatus Kentron sp. FM]VFK09718.1 MAG: hypothetical protein BECKFM1743B_GA0114221_101138 [Candidatus Kentron sp. FM]
MPASKDVVEFPGQFGPGGSGNGPGDGDLLERVVRLEGAVNQLRETVATKADILESEMRTQKLITDAVKDVDQKHALLKTDILESGMRTQELITDAVKEVDQKHALLKTDILESEMRTQKLITDAIKDVDQKHALFYRWVIGTLLSVMAIGAYLFSRK